MQCLEKNVKVGKKGVVGNQVYSDNDASEVDTFEHFGTIRET